MEKLVGDFMMLHALLRADEGQPKAFYTVAEKAQSTDMALAAWEIVRCLKRTTPPHTWASRHTLESNLRTGLAWRPHHQSLAASLLYAGASSGNLLQGVPAIISCLKFQENLPARNVEGSFTIEDLGSTLEMDRATALYFMGTMLKARIPILDTLDATAAAMSNEEAARAIKAARTSIRQGDYLLVDEMWTFLGPDFSVKIDQGERAGHLDEALLWAAQRAKDMLLPTTA